MTASILDTVRDDALLQPIDWTTIEAALHGWVIATLGLGDESVIWSDQNIAQPAYPYISMKRGNIVEGGGLTDELRTFTDLTQALGEEIEMLTVGPREFTLNIQAHVDECNGANDPNLNSVKLLSKLQASLAQLSVCSLLSTAGMAVIERLGVQDISLVLNGQFINRASFDVRIRTTSVMTERTGFIDKVQLKSDDLGIDTIVDASA